MVLHQTMSGVAAQKKIDAAAQEYAALIANNDWPLNQARNMLMLGVADKSLDLFQTAGLAKAIACFSCVAES